MPEETPRENPGRITATVFAAALLVLLIVAPVFFVRFVLTPEWIDKNVVPEFEALIGRDVEFEDLSLGFRGLSLKHLRVAEDPAFQRDDSAWFASLDRLVLKVEWLPLLQRRIVIREIILGDPKLVIHRNSQGTYNFASLMAAAEGSSGDSEDKDDDDNYLQFVADRVRLQNAHLIFLDEMRPGGALNRVEMRKLNVSADGVSPSRPFESYSTGELILDGMAPLNVKAGLQYAPAGPFIGAEIDLPLLDADALRAALASAADEADGDAASTDGTDDDADPLAMLDGYILQVEMRVERLMAAGLLWLGVDLQADLLDGNLDLSRLAASVAGGTIAGKGSLDRSGEAPRASLVLDARDIDAAALASTLAALDVVEPAGRLNATLRLEKLTAEEIRDSLTGRLPQGSDLAIEGLDVSGVNMIYRPAGSAGLAIQGLALRSDRLRPHQPCNLALSGEIGPVSGPLTAWQIDSAIDLPSGRIDNHLGGGIVDLDAALAALRRPKQPSATTPENAAAAGTATADDAAPAAPAGEATDQNAIDHKATDVELGPYDTGRLGWGLDLELAGLRAGGVDLGKVTADVELAADRLTVKRLEAGGTRGTARLEGRVDLARVGLGYHATVTLDDFDAAELVRPVWEDAWGSLSGLVDLELALDGAGTAAESWRRNLQGKGKLDIHEGRYKGSPLLLALAEFTRIDELRSQALENSGGPFRIGQGSVRTDRMTFGGPNRRAVVRGSVGLDGTLDVDARIGTAPGVANPLAETTDGLAVVKAADGWQELPLAITGSLAEPKLALPARAFSDKAIGALRDQIEKNAGDDALPWLRALGVVQPEPAAPVEETPDGATVPIEGARPAPNAVNTLLKGINQLLG